MSTSMPHQFGAHPFPPLSPPLSPPPSVMHTVFDNGVEADIHDVAGRRWAPREDTDLLAACARALRDAANVPKGRVVASVHDGTVVLDGRMSFYFERAAAECAVRFLDGVRRVENHIIVEPLALTHGVHL